MADKFRRTYKELTSDQVEQITKIKSKADEILELMNDQGSSRELSLAVTKLEEVVFWATKGISA